jgi:hypothetical protein
MLLLKADDNHARTGWTLQEFCNASRVIVLTQEGDGLTVQSSYASLNKDDEEMASRMRDEQLRKVVGMKPFWLYGGGLEEMDEGEVVRRQEVYMGLVGRLHAEEQADLPRALYPLVWGRPVESQEELMELVRQISRRTASSPRCCDRARLDLSLLVNTYSRVGDMLSRVASRLSNSGATLLRTLTGGKRTSTGDSWHWACSAAESGDDADSFLQNPEWNIPGAVE